MALYPLAVTAEERQYTDAEALFAGHGFNIREAAYEFRPRHPEESLITAWWLKTSSPFWHAALRKTFQALG
jgi:hypothetical protein